MTLNSYVQYALFKQFLQETSSCSSGWPRKDLEKKTKTYYVVSCYHVGKRP